MAFSVGFISYTISKLISKGVLEAQDSVDEFTFVDTSKEKADGSELDGVTYNEKEIAELFDKMMKPDDFEETKDVNPFEDDVELVKVEKSLEKAIEDIYEEITLTESYLRYGQDFGDMANLRMRNDFVFKSSNLSKQKSHDDQKDQQQRVEKSGTSRIERLNDEQKRADELLLQKQYAEKYTRRFSKTE